MAQRFEAMHSAMLPEGKEEVLRQASRYKMIRSYIKRVLLSEYSSSGRRSIPRVEYEHAARIVE